MPIKFSKKPKASNPEPSVPLKPREESTPITSFLDPSNRKARTPIMMITDGSPSLTGFTDAQLKCACTLVDDLRRLPETARSVMMDIVQIGTPPATTGFHEIGKFEVPGLCVASSTPLHSALDCATRELGGLCSDLRALGIERTESVVIITTDGHANSATAAELSKSIEDFLKMGKKWSVTNLVVGIGNDLDEALLKRLTNGVPPLRIDKLNAGILLPFFRQVSQSFGRSRPGQEVKLDLPDGIEMLGGSESEE